MSSDVGSNREGSLDAPTRHPLNWQDEKFYDQQDVEQEMERVFDICHGCRRCFSLCHAFPTLFDLIDESETMELDGVPKEKYWDVVDQCYLCDMCFMTKCPYVPPHPFDVDFPHLMLRAKAVKHKGGKSKTRDKILSSTDTVGKLAGIPVVVNAVNAVNESKTGRAVLEKTLGVHRDARLPKYHSKTLRKTATPDYHGEPVAAGPTRGRAVLFTTCYGNFNGPRIGADLIEVFEHNEIPVTLVDKEQCCGMPKLELGDLGAVARAKETNVPTLARMVDEGYDIIAPVPSCVLMFKQELPLMYPQDEEVQKVKAAMFDPFEYLMHRHKAGLMKTDFKEQLGKIAYHVACHLRVQNIGQKTRELLELVPGTEIQAIERCSGHDGTYAVKKEFHETSMKICKPVVNRVKQFEADYYSSDCPMAGDQIANGVNDGSDAIHPVSLLRKAYGILGTHKHDNELKMGKQLTTEDLYSLEEYAKHRKEFRARVMSHKKNRTVHLGAHATLYFEDRLTIQYQIQEMLRVEKIFEPEGIREELDSYNPLIPDGRNLKATFMIEYPDVEERKRQLARLVGIEDSVWVKVEGFEPVYAVADEDLERDTEEKTSSVHFMRFELNDEMCQAAKSGAALSAGVEHANYTETVDPVPEAVHKALVEDFN